MDPLTIGIIGVSAASALGNLISSSQNNSYNKSLNNKQLQLSREQFDYQKSLNQQIMEREDSSYQRAVSDMSKAGLNPLSVTGGASASSMSAGPSMSAGSSLGAAPAVDFNTVASMYSSVLNNATSENIAELQQKGVSMQAAYQYDVGMANAFANQLSALTEYKRSGVGDPEILKALKDQIIAEAREATNNARSSGISADLLDQEYQGRAKSGNYRGMPNRVAEIREGKVAAADFADEVKKLADSINTSEGSNFGFGKTSKSQGVLQSLATAMDSSVRKGAQKQAARQLLRGYKARNK